MKHLARALLKVVTLGIPVVIAACYGMAYKFSKTGKVIDKATHEPIQGIQVTCADSDAGFGDGYGSMTTATGDFTVNYNNCPMVKAEDVDGTANGSYQTATVPVNEQSATITIEMDKVP